jgi:peptide/nickel transport system ATP-binding protein
MSLLDVRNLSIDYLCVDGTPLHAVDDVSLSLERGRSLGIVGESGCGKTTAMLGILRLLPAEGRIVGGEALFEGSDLFSLTESGMQAVRWKHLSLVFQGAMNALNPVRRVGAQIAEAIKIHERGTSQAQINRRVRDLLDLVGITPEMVRRYPHEYSGGMRQRAMIAMALACSPEILIADEPTTALDVMVQAQILDLLQDLQQDLGLSIILVTHDLGVVAEICDDVVVMYAGKVMEYGSVDVIYNNPEHPYTQRLLQAFPDVDEPHMTLTSIPGYPPPLDAMPPGCRFEPRCQVCTSVCATKGPELVQIGPGHFVACNRQRENLHGTTVGID